MFLHKKIVFHFLSQKVTKFCSKKKKWKKIFLCKNNFGKYFFRKKKCFWILCPKKWLTSAVKKKTEKKYFFYKNKFRKNFFYKKKLQNIFLEKNIWKYFFGKKYLKIFFPLFSREGGQLSGKFGYICTSPPVRNIFKKTKKKITIQKNYIFRYSFFSSN